VTHTQQWAPPGPGIYSGVPAEVYHRAPVPGGSLSSTGARQLLPPTPSPAARQTLAPTYYATRRLHAGPNDRTGLLPTISADTRCPR